MSAVDAGALDTPIYLAASTQIEDSSGGARLGPGDETLVWASIMPMNWRQTKTAEQRQIACDVVATIRWQADLVGFGSGHMRYTDRAAIEHRLVVQTCIDPDGMGERLELYCVEKTGGPS